MINNAVTARRRTATEPKVVVLKMVNQTMINYNYLIVDPTTKYAVIVDPAWEMDKVDQALKENGATLKGVLITHTHPDHIHLAKAVADKYRTPIWMSNQEIASSGFDAYQLIGIDPVPFKVGNMTINPILTPGHTPGCICFEIGDNLFTGDVLFAEGCGICFSLEGAIDMYDSLERLKVLLKPHTRIYPGHCYVKEPGQFFKDVLKRNMYLQFPDQDSFVAYRLRQGQTQKKVLQFKDT